MKQIWQIFSRDVRRIGRVPRAWVILIGVLFTPAFYSWLTVAAFWDPYGNTQDLAIAVVNEDTGATSLPTGTINVGAKLEANLAGNDKLDWQTMDAAAAEKALNSGDVYATITIPQDFSANLLSVLGGTYTRPQIDYRVSEKNSAIAPKVTDAAVAQIQQQIAATFKQAVGQAAADTVKDKGADVERAAADTMSRTSTAFSTTAENVESSRAALLTVGAKLSDAERTTQQARTTAADARQALRDAHTALSEVDAAIGRSQEAVVAFTDSASQAFVDTSTALAAATSQANQVAENITFGVERAGSRVQSATDLTREALAATDASLTELNNLLATAPLAPEVAAPLREGIGKLEQGNADNRALLESLSAVGNDTADAAADARAAAAAITDATGQAQRTAGVLRDTTRENIPALTHTMSALRGSAAAMSAGLGQYERTLGQADGLLEGIGKQLGATGTTLQQFGTDLGSLRDGLQAVSGDFAALRTVQDSRTLANIAGLNPEDVGQFFAQPVVIEQHSIYPVGSYGSAMAALFTNLSLWIGALMLLVVFRTEVDKEQLNAPTVRQAYFARFLLVACLAPLQALVVTVGELILGVHTVNAAAFMATAVVISLAYLSIVYALCSALGNVGRALVIVITIMQIPGSSGMYPIELMPGFFRALYPLLPFHYGIDGLRETIGGFYHWHYAHYMLVLLAMAIVALLGGIIARLLLSPAIAKFNAQLKATDLFVYEEVEITGHSYRLVAVPTEGK